MIEYVSAELMELGGNCAKRERKKDITSLHIQEGYKADEELFALLQNYTPTVGDAAQKQAMDTWRAQASELWKTLEHIPIEELSNCINTLQQELRVIDATASVRDALLGFTEELQDQVS